MLSNDNATRKIIEILNNIEYYDENPNVDFKVKLHNINGRENIFEFVKDIIAMLNSTWRPEEDRFIIYGAIDNRIIGIDKKEIKNYDDALLQQEIFVKHINPIPHIEFKKFPARLFDDSFNEDKYFAGLYIPASNFGKVYELKNDFDITEKDDVLIKVLYRAGTAFSRVGSSTMCLREQDRVLIRSFKKENIVPQAGYVLAPDVTLSTLFTFSWNENCREDVEIIESFSNIKYHSIQNHIKNSISNEEGIFEYTNGVWKILDYKKFSNKYFQETTEKDLLELKDKMLDVLLDVDTKFKLSPDRRILGGISNYKTTYSKDLKKGIIDFLNYIGNNSECFQSISSSKIKSFVFDVVYQVLTFDNWMVLATLDNLLPYLAEASPYGYISGVKDSLKNSYSIKKLFAEKEVFISETKYGQWLVVGLEIIGRSKVYFSKAFNLLVTLTDYCDYSAESLTRLLLPWRPQTNAEKEERIGCGSSLAEHESLWRLLISWLPNKLTWTYDIWPSRYMPTSSIETSVAEYRDVCVCYAKALLNSIDTNLNKIKSIVESLQCYLDLNLCDIFVDAFTAFFNNLNLNNTEESECRFMIWDLLNQDIILWQNPSNPIHKIYKLNEDKINTLLEVYNPKSLILTTRRLFSHESYELISRKDWKTEEEEIDVKRIEVLEKLYVDSGFDGLIKVCDYDINKELLGIFVAKTSFADDVFDDMINLLKINSNKFELSQGYLWKRQQDNSIDIFSVKEMHTWDTNAVVLYYSSFTTSKETWDAAEELLKDKSNLYWKVAKSVRENLNDSDLEHYCKMMNSVGRFREFLMTIALMLHDEKKPNVDVVFNALMDVKGEIKVQGVSAYDLKQCVKYLESENYNRKNLFSLEWKTYAVLKEDEGSLFIHQEISRSSKAFMFIFNTYKGEFPFDTAELSSEKKEQMTNHAFEILYEWKVTPGTIDGKFNYNEFEKWVSAITNCIKDDYINVFWQFFGKNLFYSPEDKSGLFINQSIASFINKNESLIDAYTMEAFNSRGVFTVDETGQADDDIADKYDEQANELEKEGLTKFAEGLRDLARRYRRSANELRENNQSVNFQIYGK